MPGPHRQAFSQPFPRAGEEKTGKRQRNNPRPIRLESTEGYFPLLLGSGICITSAFCGFLWECSLVHWTHSFLHLYYTPGRPPWQDGKFHTDGQESSFILRMEFLPEMWYIKKVKRPLWQRFPSPECIREWAGNTKRKTIFQSEQKQIAFFLVFFRK